MTEKQGGSDVRANTTVAIPLNSSSKGEGAEYVLTGHKAYYINLYINFASLFEKNVMIVKS